MSKEGESAFSDVLWERFPEEKEYYVCSATEHAPPGLVKVRMSRNDDYQIDVEFEGDDAEKWEKAPASFDLEVGAHPKIPSFKIENCLIYQSSIHVAHEQAPAVRKGKIRPWAVKIGDPEAAHDELVEWCINGPGGWFMFPHGSKTEFKASMKVSIENSKDEEIVAETHESWLGSQSSLDSLFLATETCGFLVRKVPQSLHKMPGMAIGVHYRAAWGEIPDDKTRRHVAEILGFLFDAEPIHVGTTHFKGTKPTFSASYNVPTGPIRYLCSKPRHSPIFWQPWEGYDVSKTATRLVCVYLKQRENWGLNEALAYYHLAERTTVGYNFPLYFASIQGLLTRWAEKSGNQLLQFHMDPADFEKAVAHDIGNAVQNVPEQLRPDLKKNMLNANRLSQNEAKKRLWAAVGPISKEENEALEARHSFAHGGAVQDLLKSGKAYTYQDACRRVAQRLILILLGAWCPYMVYGTGKPEVWEMDARKLPAAWKLLDDGKSDP